jgi:hypothetical protein
MKASEILKEWIDRQTLKEELYQILADIETTDYQKNDSGSSEWFTYIFKIDDKYIAVDMYLGNGEQFSDLEVVFLSKLESAYFVEPYQELVTYYRSV